MPSASTTDLLITNVALQLLGADTIGAFADDSATAEICNATYEDTVRKLLTEAPWRFAIKEVDLGTEDATEPLTKWEERFALPTSGTLLKVLGVFVDNSPIDYEVVGQFIHCDRVDADNPVCRYIFRADTDDFSPMFVQALQFRLAAIWAVPITDSASKAEYYDAKAERVIQRAKTSDAQQDTARRLPVGRFKAIR